MGVFSAFLSNRTFRETLLPSSLLGRRAFAGNHPQENPALSSRKLFPTLNVSLSLRALFLRPRGRQSRECKSPGLGSSPPKARNYVSGKQGGGEVVAGGRKRWTRKIPVEERSIRLRETRASPDSTDLYRASPVASILTGFSRVHAGRLSGIPAKNFLGSAASAGLIHRFYFRWKVAGFEPRFISDRESG